MASLHILRRSLRHAHNPSRTFSTTTPSLSSLQWDRNNPSALASTVPPYPYGPPQWYKQSRSGLYGSARIQFGNNVSGRFETKTRRRWQPNIKTKRLFSKALNRNVQVRVSTRVLRTIDKLGGLDEYLLGEKEGRVRELGESGWWLRWAVMQTNGVKKRFAKERELLGLPADQAELRVQEEDAEATLAASIPDAEVAELSAAENAELDAEIESGVSEAIAVDDAFQIEEAKDLPPLRFRVGKGQFIMLTENGWRRVIKSDNQKNELERVRAKVEKTMMLKRRMAALDDMMGSKEMRELSITYANPPEAAIEEPAPAQEDSTADQAIPEASDAPITAAETAETAPSSSDEPTEPVAAESVEPVTRLLTDDERRVIRNRIANDYRKTMKQRVQQELESEAVRKEERRVARRERAVERRKAEGLQAVGEELS